MRKILDENYAQTIKKAQTQHDGRAWLLDNGCPTRLLNNCIYYDHRTLFTFDWHPAIEPGTDLDWLLSNLSEFPFEYEIVTTHRGVLSGRS